HGAWRLLDVDGWPDNQSCRNLLAWSWTGGEGGSRHVVVVNLSGQPAQGRIPLDWPDLPGHPGCLTDLLRHEGYDRDATELAAPTIAPTPMNAACRIVRYLRGTPTSAR